MVEINRQLPYQAQAPVRVASVDGRWQQLPNADTPGEEGQVFSSLEQAAGPHRAPVEVIGNVVSGGISSSFDPQRLHTQAEQLVDALRKGIPVKVVIFKQ